MFRLFDCQTRTSRITFGVCRLARDGAAVIVTLMWVVECRTKGIFWLGLFWTLIPQYLKSYRIIYAHGSIPMKLQLFPFFLQRWKCSWSNPVLWHEICELDTLGNVRIFILWYQTLHLGRNRNVDFSLSFRSWSVGLVLASCLESSRVRYMIWINWKFGAFCVHHRWEQVSLFLSYVLCTVGKSHVSCEATCSISLMLWRVIGGELILGTAGWTETRYILKVYLLMVDQVYKQCRCLRMHCNILGLNALICRSSEFVGWGSTSYLVWWGFLLILAYSFGIQWVSLNCSFLLLNEVILYLVYWGVTNTCELQVL